MGQAESLRQELARECTKCVNTYSGLPMLVSKGAGLQCKLKRCNRKRHIAKMKELEKLENESHKD